MYRCCVTHSTKMQDLARALTALLDDVIKEPELNTKDELMRRAKELLA